MDDDESRMQLEEALAVARNALLPLPSSTQVLLPLLDNLENILMRVKQLPFNTIQRALDPLLKMLTTTELVNHLDVDVRVFLAACFTQILRITAPSAHDIKQMKEILQVIVSAFENMSNKSSLSYHKQVSILGTMARSRSCLLMVDLHCDTLILDLFKYFLRNIRENHPAEVFSSMGITMIVVLEEIKEVPVELISTLLDSVRKRNQDILLVTRKLGERVIENCALKLAPYIHEALQHSGFPLCDYCRIVANICALQLQTLENNVNVNSQDGDRAIHLNSNELSDHVSTPSHLDARGNGSLTSTMSIGNKADKESDSRSHSSNAKFLGHAAKRRVKMSKDPVDLPQASGCSLMEEFRSPSQPEKVFNQEVGGSPSLVQSSRVSNIVSLQAEGIKNSTGGVPEECSLPGQDKKRMVKKLTESMNPPQASGCSMVEEAHSTSELVKVGNHNIVSSPSLSKPPMISEISCPQENDNACREDHTNEESSAALQCTPKDLTDGTSPEISRGQGRKSLPSDTLEADGVTKESGGRQPKENASEVDEGTTTGRNSADEVLQSGRGLTLAKTPIAILKKNCNPDMKKGFLSHFTCQDISAKPRRKKAKVIADSLTAETTLKCTQNQEDGTSSGEVNFAEVGSGQKNKSLKDVGNLSCNHTHVPNSEDESGQNGAISKIRATNLAGRQKDHSFRKGGIDKRRGRKHLPTDFLLKDLIHPRCKKPRTNKRSKSLVFLSCNNLGHVKAALQKDPATSQQDR